MANENKDIGDIVKKCKVLLLDIEGTTTSISFVKDKLFPYAEENVKQFLESEWESQDVKEAVTALRKLALEDKENSVEGLVTIPGEDATKEDQIEGLVNNVKWQMSSDRKVGALKQLQGLIWKQGYDKGDIKGHVYDDVSSALESWHSVDGQKIYIYSSGSVQAQKLLFGQSLAGDLLKYIDGHFDTAVGGKQESASYTAIVEKVDCKPDEILFLTDIVKEAEAARAAGLHVALVSREGNTPLTSEATDAFAVIHSLAQLTVSNKRKTEPQDEQPAKVPKTDVSNDVKTETDTAKESPAPEKETEQMEVEVNTPEEKIKKVEEPVKENTDVSPKDEATVAPKTTEVSESKTEAMETDSTENHKPSIDVSSKAITEHTVQESITENKTETESNVPKESESKKEENGSAEETPPTIITEIEEISDKENLNELAEIIEDLEPIVEEPTAGEDIEELQNVGEVLEKECDEILSKVQDVTNLDNIPLKPILNPIVEESMEAENTDSNDIVESILEGEIELEKKLNNDKTEPVKEPTEIAPVETTDKPTDTEKPESESLKENKEITESETKTTTETTVSETTVVESEESIKEQSETNSSQDKQDKEEKQTTETKTADESTDKTTEIAKSVENKPTESTTEPKVNGKTNGETDAVNQNGDAKTDLSRLENGKEVNGANGDSVEENGNKESIDIKVKTVTTDERTELIEQPTEA